ncbi:hypothetical protein JKF63_00652 [Porcisia hertigi]|uniref:Tubulin-tyrosine ligase n=1 Tax=Porcisia hertigi TaxID=2761500 RepID=A0A836HQC8_9TRYP|nr:hypothetical protein JKF63_00652 [Porcisia hertigi]
MSVPEQHVRRPPGDVVIDCQHTRYDVVRAAARMVGWTVCDSQPEKCVPTFLPGVSPDALNKVTVPPHASEVLWVDKSVVRTRVAGLACYQRLNHYTAMDVIARKALLFRRLMQLMRLQTTEDAGDGCSAGGAVACDPGRGPSTLGRFLAQAVPASFSSLTDLSRLAAFRRCAGLSSGSHPVFFIIKPNTGCEGRGIRLTTSPEEDLTEEERTDKKKECIIQLYVDRPLLIGARKFDLRLYVLLVAVVPQQHSRRSSETLSTSTGHSAATITNGDQGCLNPTEVPRDVQGVELYVHREGIVRICAEPYSAPTEENSCEASRHLTNYAVNKSSTSYVPAADAVVVEANDSVHNALKQATVAEDREGSNKQSLAAFASFIESLQTPGGWPRVRRRIDECVVLTVLSGVEVLRRELIGAGGTRGHRADGRSCFELLGFDVMLREEDLQPVLMEVNHSPSLFCDTTFDFAVKSAVLRDTFRLLETHMPPWGQHEGNPKRYELCVQGEAKRRLERQTDMLVRGATAEPFGFRRLLPHYIAGRSADGAGESADARDMDDWSPAERAAQQRIVELSRRLR